MPKTDIARRVYNHTWKLDPIVRSLLDTDFYKLLMLQMIWGLYPKVEATFSLINRKHSVFLTEEIDEHELRAQLDHARTLRFTKKEMIWLAGNSFYGSRQIFSPEFLRWLKDFQLPDYQLEKRGGQYELSFPGRWAETSMWEIPALAIINELRSRGALRDYGPFTLDVTYARAKAKMWEKVERLKRLKDLRISDFGTRRRHSFLWQRWCVEALKEGLGDNFTGTSNVLLAMDNDLEALGTNAHELPMVLAALAPNEEVLKAAPYQVLQDWESYYGGNLKIVLPDAFGTEAFLRSAPDWVADWTGFRPDSAPEIEGGERLIKWWTERGRDPREKLLVFSDGLDVDAIEGAYNHFSGRVRMAFGWGTNLTNDFIDCSPFPNHRLDPISLVVKVTSANGRPAVKLSDNPETHPAFLSGVRTSLEAAFKLGAKAMIVTTGDERHDVSREVQHAALVKVLKEAADIVKGSGVVLVLETLNDRVDHVGYYLTSTVEGLDIIDEVDRPEVRLVYDIYHSAMMGEHTEDVLDGRLDRVAHVHLADTQGRGEPGSGNMDWEARLDWLADHGYTGFIGLEYKPTGSTEESLSFMR